MSPASMLSHDREHSKEAEKSGLFVILFDNEEKIEHKEGFVKKSLSFTLDINIRPEGSEKADQ